MRILIADDHALFRDSLRSLLEAHDLDVVAEAKDGKEAVEMAWDTKPDVVLMDLTMPEMNGLEATKQLAAELPDVKVVILTASDDDTHLFDAIKAGAKGYLLKDLESGQFFSLLEGVDRGEPALTPAVARKLLDEFARPKRQVKEQYDPDALTDRERQVLELMVQGTTSNRKLAKLLGVSENTIKFHVRNILDKLHLHNRAQVVAYALRKRIVEPPTDDE
ncbi:MAG: response regulator transcription factor [Acidobacteria bacterium]|nr:MAG: response regulator transcription factor [Acidobacteriota bacterium]